MLGKPGFIYLEVFFRALVSSDQDTNVFHLLSVSHICVQYMRQLPARPGTLGSDLDGIWCDSGTKRLTLADLGPGSIYRRGQNSETPGRSS